MDRILWIVGTVLAVIAMLFMASGALGTEGVIDYRAWLLLAIAIVVAAIGNFSRTSGHGG